VVTEADNNSRKLRLRCGSQFPWCALVRSRATLVTKIAETKVPFASVGGGFVKNDGTAGHGWTEEVRQVAHGHFHAISHASRRAISRLMRARRGDVWSALKSHKLANLNSETQF
jgi:hypothetical protein